MYVDVDGVNEIDSSQWSKPSFDTHIPKADYHKSIAFGADKDLNFDGRDISYISKDYHDGKVEDLFSSTMWGGETVIAKSKPDVTVGGGIEVTWGDKNGPTYEWSATTSVGNDKAQVDVSVKGDSEGNTSLSADVQASTTDNNAQSK